MKYKIRNERDLNLPLMELIFKNRKVDYSSREEFFNPSVNVIQNPFVYDRMMDGINSFVDALRNKERFGVLVDCDCDGYCSAAIMINYMKDNFGYYIVHDDSIKKDESINEFIDLDDEITIFMHHDKSHGLTLDIMEKVLDSNITYLIIPDAGSNDYEQHKILKQHGIEVLVLDHHEAEKVSDDAIVINNHMSCRGNKNLSGAGVVIKFLEALDITLGKESAWEYLDLVAVAMIADVMKINDMETRFYCTQGFNYINNKLLDEIYHPTKARNYEAVSFDVAPLINAFIRLGSDKEKKDLLLALLNETSKREIEVRGSGVLNLELPQYISRLGSKIKSRQTTAINKTIESFETKIITENKFITFVFIDKDTPATLTGLIANKLADYYSKPCLVMKENIKDGEIVYSGSGRSIPTFDCFKDFLKETELFDLCEGHQSAFGVIIKQSNIEMLMDMMSLDKMSSIPSNFGVFEVENAYFDNVSAYDIFSVDGLNKHWSNGFEKPKFYIKLDATKCEINIIGKGDTLRIKHNNITYIKFRCTPNELESLSTKNATSIEMIGTFSMNNWMNRSYPQVIIEQIEIN